MTLVDRIVAHLTIPGGSRWLSTREVALAVSESVPAVGASLAAAEREGLVVGLRCLTGGRFSRITIWHLSQLTRPAE